MKSCDRESAARLGRRRGSVSATKEGLQKLLEFFLYGMLRTSESLGNVELFLRRVEEEGLRKFMIVNMPKFMGSASAADACKAYTREADAEGLFEGSDTSFREDGGTIRADIDARCTYRRVCTLRHDEGLPIHCIRAYGLAEMLRIRLDAHYDWTLEAFGLPCRIRMTQTPRR